MDVLRRWCAAINNRCPWLFCCCPCCHCLCQPKSGAASSEHDNNGFSTIVPETNQIIATALFDFSGLEPGDLEFRAGDEMIIIDQQNDDWWRARHLATNQEGNIPRNYVTIDESKTSYWFDINRRDAETLLLLPGNPRGAYMVRQGRDTIVLSVRNFDSTADVASVKHYRLFKTEDGLYYVSSKTLFDSIDQLIEYYKYNDGICHRLTEICRRRPELLPFKHFEVERQHIQLVSRLGKGQFGEVWKATWLNKVDVAVKQLLSDTSTHMNESQFLQEAEILHRMRHRHLVTFMGVCTKDGPICIVMELVKHGSLLEYLRNKDNRSQLMYHVLIDMATQICEGMAHLEKNRCIHRDLRAANVLVDDGNVVKVSDVGMARLLQLEEVYFSTSKEFPVRWTAPEALDKQLFTTKSDVWSFGILLFEIVSHGSNPYPGRTNAEVHTDVMNGYRMPNPTCRQYSCPNQLYDIMTACWDENPDERPSFAELLQTFSNYLKQLTAAYEFESAD